MALISGRWGGWLRVQHEVDWTPGTSERENVETMQKTNTNEEAVHKVGLWKLGATLTAPAAFTVSKEKNKRKTEFFRFPFFPIGNDSQTSPMETEWMSFPFLSLCLSLFQFRQIEKKEKFLSFFSFAAILVHARLHKLGFGQRKRSLKD